MRVALELTALQLDRAGTSRAIRQLADGLGDVRDVEVVEFQHSKISATAEPARGLTRISRGLAREFWYFPYSLPRTLARAEVDILHCPSPLVPPKSPVPMVVTLHDAIGWDHPELLTRANALQLRHRLPRAIEHGAHVITSSDYSRARLIAALGVDESRIHVIRPGVSEVFRRPASPEDDSLVATMGVTGRFLLTVGTLQPRKNVETALIAFERLAAVHADLGLAIVGARGWDDNALVERIESSEYGDRIFALGRVTDDELAALYRRAACFVFASRYEGFGFPPLESMAAGTPVVSSPATSIGEILGDAALVADPDAPGEFADAVESVISSESRAEGLRRRGLAWTSTFTASRYCDETVGLYRRIISQAQ